MSVSPIAFEPAHDARDHLVDALGFDRALLHRDADRALELVAVEILALAGGFYHHEIAQLHALIGGETAGTGRAEAPPPDRNMILGRAGILHLRVDITAKRTAHVLFLERCISTGTIGITAEVG